MLDVRDYGVIGNGVADDTAALQALVNLAPARERIYFPTGAYKVSGTIDCGSKGLTFCGDGQGRPANVYLGGAVLIGTVAGPLLKVAYPASGVTIADMGFSNLHAAGIGVDVGGNAIALERLSISAYNGIKSILDTFTLAIRSVQLVWNGNTAGSVGILLGGHASVHSADVVGFDHGIRVSGIGVDIRNCRIEVNKVGIVAGMTSTGATSQLTGSAIEAIALEANDVGLWVVASTGCRFGSLLNQGSVNSPAAGSKIGVLVGNAIETDFADMAITGGYSQAAVRVGQGGRQRWRNVIASNTIADAIPWDVQGGLQWLELEQCNYKPRPDDFATNDLRRALVSYTLRQHDLTRPAAEGRNLRGKLTQVPSGSTSLSVTFIPNANSGAAAINTATPQVGIGTLIPGTVYYYISTILTPRGETGATLEKVVTLGPLDTQVLVVLYGGSLAGPGTKRRLYRGRTSGQYDGYWEFVGYQYTDTGLPFFGRKSPPWPGQDAETGTQEPDADYAVIPSASWPTRVGVTGRATTGFTLTFDVPAPAGATVDWLMVR